MPESQQEDFPKDVNVIDGNIIGNITTVIVVLIVIIILIVLLIRFLGKRNRFFSQSRSIQTLGAVGLGVNKSLQIIKVGGSVYVIGVGEDISLIDKVSDQAEVEILRSAFEDETTDLGSISSMLSNVVNRLRREKSSAVEDEELEGKSFQEVFESRLEQRPSRKQQMEELLKDEQSTDRSRNS